MPITPCTDELRGSGSTYYGAYVTAGHYSTIICPTEGGTRWVLSNPRLQTK